MRGRMQYAPTWMRPTSTDKEYYPCGRSGTYRGVCYTPLSGYDQLLQIKNTSYVNDRVHSGAYAIRPYWVMNNFC